MGLGTETITVIRAVGTDWRGDPLPGDPTETDVPWCSVQPTTTVSRTTERTDQRTTITDSLTVYAPPGTDVKATDRVRWRGVEYQVVGQPAPWRDLDGIGHYTGIRITDVEG